MFTEAQCPRTLKKNKNRGDNEIARVFAISIQKINNTNVFLQENNHITHTYTKIGSPHQ